MDFGGNSRDRVQREEFEAAALPHLNDLFRTAIRLSGEHSRAEDIVQEVYMEAWKSFHRFEVGTNCRAWLFKILINVTHHHRRVWFKWKFEKDSEEILGRRAAAEEPVPDKLTDKAILAALDGIPTEFREVVLLSDVEELTYKEIVSILDVPMGTVMSRLSRGRKVLRQQLSEVAVSYGVLRARVAGEGA